MTGHPARPSRPAGSGPGGAPAPVAFLSDFGHRDEFVGVVHAVLRRVAPGVEIVDLGHEVPAHDVAAGAAMLARAVPYLDGFVVLGVVDPGVGTSRRRVAVEAGDLVLVGPDNGLLVPAADAAGGARAAVELTDARFWWPGPRAVSFDGRDVFGPVAAHLAAGVALADLGRPLDPDGLCRPPGPAVERGPGWLAASVVWVDRFGNVELGAAAGDLAGLSERLTVSAGARSEPARRVVSFGELGPGELGVMVDSSGRPSVVLDRASAAALLDVSPGDRVELADRRL